jgi:hypothetical protein
MARSVRLIASIYIAMVAIHASAAEPIVRLPAKVINIVVEKNEQWSLGLIDGEIRFLGRWHGDQDDQELPLIPSDGARHARTALAILRDGDTLQVEVSPYKQQWSTVQAEKNHWFLTGKYAEKNPEVILTKEATKFSRWEFVRVEGAGNPEIKYYYIRNINDVGKDAWLAVEPTGVRYRWHREVRKAKLSFSDKEEFGVEDAYGDGR